jgi:hypothetical protein
MELENRGKTFVLRQWLNLLFIVLAIVGMILWYSYSHDAGAYTLIAASVFKFVELSLRIMKI